MWMVLFAIAASVGWTCTVFLAFAYYAVKRTHINHKYQNSQELIEGVDSLLKSMPNAPSDQIHQLKEARRYLVHFREIISNLPLSFARRRAS